MMYCIYMMYCVTEYSVELDKLLSINSENTHSIIEFCFIVFYQVMLYIGKVIDFLL